MVKCNRMEQGGSLVDRRRRSRTLTPLIMPKHNPPKRKVNVQVEEGKELFTNFVYCEVVKEGLEAPEPLNTICTPTGYKNPIWAKAGRELRWMADEFAKTEEREKIRKRANEVGITNVTFEHFCDLLKELFYEGGFTKERIMVLFFFCSDVAVRSLKRGVDLFKQFLQWSLTFIADNVSTWVQEQGGWGRVLGQTASVPGKYYFFGAIFALTIYYGWKHFARP